mgnify:FL=1
MIKASILVLSLLAAGTAQAKTVTMNASSYCACYKCCGKRPGDAGYGITASGVKVRLGIVAVDKRFIKLGTKIKIHGMKGTYLAADTGSAIKGKRIDIYNPSHGSALRFGRKLIRVTILGRGKKA